MNLESNVKENFGISFLFHWFLDNDLRLAHCSRISNYMNNETRIVKNMTEIDHGLM